MGLCCGSYDMDSKEKILTSTFAQAIAIAKNELYRDMPWRQPLFDPYKILLSEIMLQQTQVSRVVDKYNMFLAMYPTIHDLAYAPLSDILRMWSGLGYNRRAKYLHDSVQSLKTIKTKWTYDQLVACKGIGPNTAKAVLTYSYNRPEVFIETNIRTVILYYFYKDTPTTIADAQIMQTVASLIDTKNPRVWYWAVMDLGAYLKQTNNSLLHKTHTYKKQSVFEGSNRQLRGQIIKLLGTHHSLSLDDLQKHINDSRLSTTLHSLQNEGLIAQASEGYYLGTRL